MLDDADALPSSGTEAAPSARASASQVYESGSQTVGRCSGARFGKPAAAASAATPDLSLTGRDDDAHAVDVAGLRVVAGGEVGDHLGVLERRQHAITVVHGSAPVAAGSSRGTRWARVRRSRPARRCAGSSAAEHGRGHRPAHGEQGHDGGRDRDPTSVDDADALPRRSRTAVSASSAAVPVRRASMVLRDRRLPSIMSLAQRLGTMSDPAT